jgi:hypothetical protein
MREALALRASTDLEKTVDLLRDWADWMGHAPRIGFNSRVPILSTGMGSSTFEELLEQTASVAMRAVDGSVESLPPSNKAAIMRCYGLCAVYRFPRANYPYEQALNDAHEALIISLRRKGVLI